MKAFIKEKKFIVVAVIALIIISAIGIAIFVKNNKNDKPVKDTPDETTTENVKVVEESTEEITETVTESIEVTTKAQCQAL